MSHIQTLTTEYFVTTIEKYEHTDIKKNLALYYFDGCPFCVRVLRAIDTLGLDVELRNIYEDRGYLDELREVRGRTTVPVLRITSPDGEDRWMPESADIVRYLQATYGQVAA